jgi:short-subunit dehydrogenase
MSMSASRQFAIVTGASTGIGLELAKCCARNSFDLLIAADEPEIENAATAIRGLGAAVETMQTDLSTIEGVDRL